jgi:hypothetical protein
MPTLIPLLSTAIKSVAERAKLFILLAIFTGLLTSLVYTPAIDATEKLLVALSAANSEALANTAGNSTVASAELQQLSEHIADLLPTIILGNLGLLAITGFLLPLWARVGSPSHLQPWDGSIARFTQRGMASFFHLTTAVLLTIVALGAIIMVAAIMGGFSGGASGLGVLVVVTAGIWVSVFFSGAANTGIIAASADSKLTFAEAMIKNRTFIRPIVGSLAVIWFAAILANVILEPILRGIFDGTRAVAIAQGTIGYIVAALHISVLYHIPGFIQRPQAK